MALDSYRPREVKEQKKVVDIEQTMNNLEEMRELKEYLKNLYDEQEVIEASPKLEEGKYGYEGINNGGEIYGGTNQVNNTTTVDEENRNLDTLFEEQQKNEVRLEMEEAQRRHDEQLRDILG